MWPLTSDYNERRAPMVPSELITYINGTPDFNNFLESGWEVASMFNAAAKKYTGRFINEYGNTLDFGCGCGRVARFLPYSQKLFGCDVNRNVVEYCQNNMSHFDFHQNPLMPPLKFADGFFELVYAFSVFSHLTQEVEEAWLTELARVGQSDCLYLLTVQGDWMIEKTLSDEERAETQQNGFWFKTVHGRTGGENDFPEYYESSYHTSDYVRTHWSKHFEILDVIKGDNPSRYNSSGNELPDIRAMGQDLVVARKR